MSKTTDISLVAQVAVFGNGRAFDELVRRYQSPVRRFFLNQTLGDSHQQGQHEGGNRELYLFFAFHHVKQSFFQFVKVRFPEFFKTQSIFAEKAFYDAVFVLFWFHNDKNRSKKAPVKGQNDKFMTKTRNFPTKVKLNFCRG